MNEHDDWRHTDDELLGRDEFPEEELRSQGFQESVGEGIRWDNTTELLLPIPTHSKDADSDSLTWPIPIVDHVRGHGHFFAHAHDGTKSQVTIWDDGRVNWYLSWRSSRRHGGNQTVSMSMKLIWRYKDSHHPITELPRLGTSMSFDDGPQGRFERLPWRPRVNMNKSLFQLYTHANVYGVASAHVHHK